MFKKLLTKIAKVLDARNIPYMIIGGQAILLYGEPRLTRDIDITLGIKPDKLNLLLPVLDEVGLSTLIEDVSGFVKSTMVLPTKEPKSGIRVDFIFSFTPYERRAIKDAKKIKIGHTYVRFASLEDTIIHKIFAGRPRDMEDVKSILLKNPNIDVQYIKRWLNQFAIALNQLDIITRFNRLWENLTKG